MPDLSSLLLKIPDEYKPMAALAIGAFVLVFIAVFHGWGLQRILHRNKRGELRLRSRRRPNMFGAALLFGWAVFLMLVLRLVEVLMWVASVSRVGASHSQRNLLLRQCLYHARHGKPRSWGALADHQPHHRNLRTVHFCLDNQFVG